MKATVYKTDFYSDAFILDPIRHYAEMRAAGPVVWLPENGAYAAVQYDAVVEVLRSADRWARGR